MKKITMLAAAPLIMLSLAACDKKNNDEAAMDSAPPPPPPIAAPAVPPPPPPPPVMVTPETAPETAVPSGDSMPGETGAPVLNDTTSQAPADMAPPSAAQPNPDTPVKEKN